jgi:prepilin-type processing-associated H-X9-DG protein
MGLALMLGIAGLVMLAAFSVSVAWVWRDANRRGQPGFIVAVLVTFLFWPLSLLVWLAARPAVQGGAATPARSGRGCLWAALITLFILGLLTAIPIWLLLNAAPMKGGAREAARRIKCMNNVKQLAVMYSTYAANHGGTPPRSLEDLRQYGLVDGLLHCPAAGKDGPPSYRLFPGSNATDLIIIEKPGNHGVGGYIRSQGCNVGYGDGHVAWTVGRPVSTRAVIMAIEKQLQPGLATYAPELDPALVRVGQVIYDAAANSYQAEVFWTMKGQKHRSLVPFKQFVDDDVQATGIGKYMGSFPLNDLKPDPRSTVTQRIIVDELMDGPTVEKERP